MPVRSSSTEAYCPVRPICERSLAASFVDVQPGDPGAARVGLQQGREDPDGGGLAGAVRAEDAEDGALPGGQVDPGERLGLAEALGEAVGLDGVRHARLLCLGAGCSHPMTTTIPGVAGTARTRRCHRALGGVRHLRRVPCRSGPLWQKLRRERVPEEEPSRRAGPTRLSLAINYCVIGLMSDPVAERRRAGGVACLPRRDPTSHRAAPARTAARRGDAARVLRDPGPALRGAATAPCG